MASSIGGKSGAKLPSDMDSISMISDDSMSAAYSGVAARQKKLLGTGIWFKWSSPRDFILFAVVCTMNTWCYAVITNNFGPDIEKTPNIVQYILMFLLVGLPLIYMQVSIGQYTQRGVIFIKEICPIVHGTAYTTLLTILIRSIEIALNITITLIYLLSSCNQNLQWLKCPAYAARVCWNSSTPCQKECLNTLTPTAKLYYYVMHLEILTYKSQHESLRWVTKKLLPLVCSWVLVIVCLGYTRVSYRKLIAIVLFITLFLFIILFVGSFVTHGSITFTKHLIKYSMKQFVSVDVWARTFHMSFQILSLGRGLYITTGTFLAPKAHSALLSIGITIMVYFIVLIMSCLSFSAYFILTKFGNTPVLKKMDFGQEEATFIVIPQSFEFSNIPQFWSFIFFACSLLMNMNCLITNIVILEKCFTDSNQKLQRYRVYTTLFIATLIFVLCILLIKDTTTVLTACMLFFASELCEIISTTIIIVAVCILHSVQKFCDDLHFMTGNPVTRSWKIAWYLMPIVYCVLAGITIKSHLKVKMPNGREPASEFIFGCMAGILAPVVLFGAYQIWQYMKKKNLVGLLKSTEFYGSSDPEERHLRNVHNPRTEIKSKRKNDNCAHGCLINNRAFRKAAAEEQRERQQSERHEEEDEV